MRTIKPADVDEYVAGFPEDVQKKLEQIRGIIKKKVPQAKEIISYNMPAFRLNGILVYYAAHKHHIGFYPTSSGIAAFKNELSVYKGGKGSVQFPLDKPLPLNLIANIVKFRVMENMERAETKAKAT